MKFSTNPDVLNTPYWFPFSLDADAGMISFIETDRKLLSASAFIDGRTPLSRTDQVTHIPFDHALDWLEETSSQPDRLVAHTSFCGSTLLARALDIDGRCFAYKEPQILIDLAKLKAADHPISKDQDNWQALIAFCLGQLRLPWSPDETNVIKPSNWANTLLPDMVRASQDMRMVMMSLDMEAFLIAILRGGNARIAYCLNCLNHFLVDNAAQSALARTTEQAALPPLEKALRLVAILHRIQEDLFHRLAMLLPPTHMISLTKTQLISSPYASTYAISETLALGLDAAVCSTSWDRNAGNYSKASGERYDPEKAMKVDHDLARRHRSEIADVLEWATSTFPNA